MLDPEDGILRIGATSYARGIKLAREFRHITLEEAAKTLKISPTTLKSYERGSTDIPVSIYVKMLKYYSVSFDDTLCVREEYFDEDISIYFIIKLELQRKVEREIRYSRMFVKQPTDFSYFKWSFDERLEDICTDPMYKAFYPSVYEAWKNDENRELDVSMFMDEAMVEEQPEKPVTDETESEFD